MISVGKRIGQRSLSIIRNTEVPFGSCTLFLAVNVRNTIDCIAKYFCEEREMMRLAEHQTLKRNLWRHCICMHDGFMH